MMKHIPIFDGAKTLNFDRRSLPTYASLDCWIEDILPGIYAGRVIHRGKNTLVVEGRVNGMERNFYGTRWYGKRVELRPDNPGYAIKIIKRYLSKRHLFEDIAFVEGQIWNEFRTTVAVRHQLMGKGEVYVKTPFDCGVSVGSINKNPYAVGYIVFSYDAGMSLAKLFNERYVFSEDDFLAIFEAISHPLSAAHSLGLMHNDVKPGNIMATPSKIERGNIINPGFADARLIDWACAVRQSNGRNHKHMCIDGTPAFKAPELFDGNEFSVPSEIFSVGATGYYLFTGDYAYLDGNLSSFIGGMGGMPQPSVNWGSHSRVGETLAEIITACLEPNPGNRPQSIEELAEILGFAVGKNKAGEAYSRPQDFKPINPVEREGEGISPARSEILKQQLPVGRKS
ncbi:hypothetical protein HYU14_07350 [Candidatus Woesearchaeota archaeon]|nr:hypothetical protein [Candidatus Woesearchaeota archaeon]